ncbi:alkaline phosphatase [Permianibacter sp. IMCC34836]|uniref:alkaline phosphatase n=1 Tax=Permianibacter fluminis TaxID=2738515 RepID=UPI0015536D43|nr:alkaline phosphatase [Permianibacter fluminis]NQD38598.1 alkaline phosphatase [Permianibacter fluminis]
MKATVLTALALALGAATSAHAAGEAKNVIFFLGDGMGPTVVTAARLHKYGEAGQLTMGTLSRTAKIKTFSHDAQTTDSAPSMSAYMTGVKMNNEVLSMSADTLAQAPLRDGNNNAGLSGCDGSNGHAVPTLAELAKAKGKAAGVVTTTTITHATPAAVYAHICHRDAYYDIAKQAVPGGDGYNTALGNGLDVIMGGGANEWTPFNATTNNKGRADGRDLVAELGALGYTTVRSNTELAAVTPTAGSKLFGVFSSRSHLDYEFDRASNVNNTQPSLAEMTAKAIDVLKNDSDGYFLMVEGGRIDHALHGTNAKRALEDAVAFDDAIKLALTKVDLSNTLIVVTADHDHTMVFNGYGKKGNSVLDIVRDYKHNEPLLDADGQSYTTLVFGNGPNRPAIRTSVSSEQAMDPAYLQETIVRQGSETHGGGDVMLFADGAGAKSFKGTMDNTKVFSLVKDALGL